MLWYGFFPSWRIVYLPVVTLLAVLASFGPALFITALNVRYRDFRFVMPFILQFGLYVSPVGYSSSVVPEQWRFWFNLNPVVGVIDGFRWCLFGGDSQLDWMGLMLNGCIIAAFLWLGVSYFRRTEKTFADLI